MAKEGYSAYLLMKEYVGEMGIDKAKRYAEQNNYILLLDYRNELLCFLPDPSLGMQVNGYQLYIDYLCTLEQKRIAGEWKRMGLFDSGMIPFIHTPVMYLLNTGNPGLFPMSQVATLLTQYAKKHDIPLYKTTALSFCNDDARIKTKVQDYWISREDGYRILNDISDKNTETFVGTLNGVSAIDVIIKAIMEGA